MKTPISKVIHDYTAKLWMICFVIILFVFLLLDRLAKFMIQFYVLNKAEVANFGLAIIYFLLPVIALFILIVRKNKQWHK